jgi:CheY-like chemotaxis protein
LLTFAKGGTPVKELANIVPLIKESAKFASSGSTVKCEIELPEDLWPTEIDPGQLSQVIHNLVINAIQAMPEGGVVRIRGENVKLNGKTRSGLPLRSGKYIKIAVEDEGVGIWPDQLGKIFDPYFTTKQKGSGLGLATVYSILHNHTGYITADSIPSKGTTFTFYLPAYKAQVTHATKAPETLHEGTGKVLVMDDEAMIRENMEEILGLLGYSADFAEDGAKAVELYRNAQDAGEPYEVVITDLTIPGGMGGKETIQKLQELDPQVKAIVFSGYADDPILSHHSEFGFKGFIKKPYTINDVSESLHQVVSESVVAKSAAFSGEAAAERL